MSARPTSDASVGAARHSHGVITRTRRAPWASKNAASSRETQTISSAHPAIAISASASRRLCPQQGRRAVGGEASLPQQSPVIEGLGVVHSLGRRSGASRSNRTHARRALLGRDTMTTSLARTSRSKASSPPSTTATPAAASDGTNLASSSVGRTRTRAPLAASPCTMSAMRSKRTEPVARHPVVDHEHAWPRPFSRATAAASANGTCAASVGGATRDASTAPRCETSRR